MFSNRKPYYLNVHATVTGLGDGRPGFSSRQNLCGVQQVPGFSVKVSLGYIIRLYPFVLRNNKHRIEVIFTEEFNVFQREGSGRIYFSYRLRSRCGVATFQWDNG